MNDEEEEKTLGLIEDDLQIAWENLETGMPFSPSFPVARVLYSQPTTSGDFRKELADIHQKLGEIEMEKGDFESSLASHEASLALCEQLYPPASRERANCLFLCGLAQYYLAENDALMSEDDPELAPKAEKEAKESAERLRQAQSALLRCALEQAKQEGVGSDVDAKTTLAGLREAAKALQEKEGLSEKLKELLEVALDVTENVGMGRECEADREGGGVFGEVDNRERAGRCEEDEVDAERGGGRRRGRRRRRRGRGGRHRDRSGSAEAGEER